MHHHSLRHAMAAETAAETHSNLSTSASPRHHGRNGCFHPHAPPSAVRENEDAHEKNVPITIVDKNGCTRPQRASLRRSLRTRTLKPSSPPSPSPPPFVENENEDGLPPPFVENEDEDAAILVPITITIVDKNCSLRSTLKNGRMNIASSSPSPSPTKIAPSAVLES